MKKKLIFASVVSVVMTMVSCKEKDYTAYPPTWKGFQIERDGQKISNRTDIHGGDTLVVTAVQDQKGRYINSTYYKWSLTCQVYTDGEGGSYKDSVLTKQYHVNYDAGNNGNPKHTFVIPTNAQGRATISFSATYNYSSDGLQVWDGSNVGDTNGYLGSIHSTSAVLSGDAKGTLSINIR